MLSASVAIIADIALVVLDTRYPCGNVGKGRSAKFDRPQAFAAMKLNHFSAHALVSSSGSTGVGRDAAARFSFSLMVTAQASASSFRRADLEWM
jgi:hypothetical protein